MHIILTSIILLVTANLGFAAPTKFGPTIKMPTTQFPTVRLSFLFQDTVPHVHPAHFPSSSQMTFTCRFAGSTATFNSHDAANKFIPYAGLEVDPAPLGGYPHPFQNFQHFHWPGHFCTGANKLLEYPVREGETQWIKTEKKTHHKQPGDRDAAGLPHPGPYRVIYEQKTGQFCGYITHTQRLPNGRAGGDFALC